jgi:GT2 family glycosyltransferase
MIAKLLKWRVHQMTLQMAHHLVCENGQYRSTGNDPQFILHSSQRQLPRRWVVISYKAENQALDLEPILYIDEGHGFSEQCILLLPRGNGRIETIVRLPNEVKALRLDPPTLSGLFSLKDMQIVQISKLHALWRLAKNKLRQKPITLERLQHLKNHLLSAWHEQRWSGLRAYLVNLALTQEKPSSANYDTWINIYDTLTDVDQVKIKQRILGFKQRPLISVFMPLYKPHKKWLRLAIESVLAQIYQDWELCIAADDSATLTSIRQIIGHYQSRDARIKVIFIKTPTATTLNNLLEIATGQWVASFAQDHELPQHALYMIVEEINAHPQARLIYSDEDIINAQGVRCNPYFKSDWNPDLLLSQNFISHLSAYETALVRAINGFREEFEGVQDYDLTLRIIEKINPHQIRHIPHVLYHWRAIEGSTAGDVDANTYAYEAARKAIQEHLDRQQIDAYVTTAYGYNMNRVIYKLPKDLPKVSVIIPTKDKLELLRVVIEGVLEKTDYPNLELIIIDNQSTKQETLNYLNNLSTIPNVSIIAYDSPYNYAAINNLAVAQSTGDIILLVNNDIEVIAAGWLKEMVSHALRPEIGAVGALLYYNDDKIQHAGIVLCADVASHAHQFLNKGELGYHGKAHLLQNYSAVTAACMALRRTVFEEVGGFDEINLPIAYNDVDLCLRIQEKGYRILWTPYAELYHYESASLGPPTSPERLTQFLRESAYLKSRWRNFIAHDPFYSPNLTLNGGDFSLAFPPRVRKPWQAVQ